MIKKLGLIKDEDEEKPGWLKKTRGIGKLPKYEIPKPLGVGIKGKVGLGTKAGIGIKLPEKPELEEDIFKPPEIKKLGLIKEEPAKPSFDWSGTKKQIDTLTSELKDYKPTFDKYNTTLTDLSKQIDTVQTGLKTYIPGAKGIDELKAQESNLINQYNSIIGESKSLYQEYDFKHKELNKLIEQYNANLPTIEIGAGAGAGAGIGVKFEVGRITPQIKESGMKDIWDAFRLGASGMLHKTKQYFNSVLPNMIFRELTVEEAVSQYAGMTESQVRKLNEGNKKKRESYIEKYNQAQDRYVDWLRENPELQPRKEWEKGVIETIKGNPKILLEPAYWGYVAAQSAAFTIGVMGTVLATTAVTSNPLLGLATGVLVATPMQTQELYEDLIANGATLEQATKLAIPIGGLIASVEVMGDLPILASVSAPFKKLLFRNINKVVANKVGASIIKRGIKTFATIEIAETIEEVVQGAIQDATVMTVNENRSMLENIPETVIQTMMATVPFALIGLGSEAQIATQLKKKVTDVNYQNAVRVQLEEAGIIPRTEVAVLAYAEKKPVIPEKLKEKYLKEVRKEVKVADDFLELGKDIREDIPISEELQTKYPDLMKKIPEARFAEIEVEPVIPEEKEKPMIKGIDFKKNPEVYRAVAKADEIIEKSKLKIKYPLPEIDIAIKELKDAMMDKTLNVEQKKAISKEIGEVTKARKNIKAKPAEYTEIEVPKAEMLPEREKPMVEPKEAIIPEALEKQSVFLYDKPFSKLKKAELNKVLETTKQPLPDETGEYINKIGTPAKGLELTPTATEQARFIFGGFEKGLLTDSHLLVLDKDVSKAVLTDIIEKYKKARVKEVQTTEMSYKEAQKIVDKEVESHKKELVKQFPDTEKILPKDAIEKSTPLWIQGHQVTDYGPPITILTDGKIQVALDTNKLAFLNKHFPDAEIKATGENQAVLFMEGKDLKAMVMPIRVEEFPFKITGEPRKLAEKIEPTIKRISKIRPTIRPTKPKTYDLKADLTPEQRVEGNKLIGRIQAIVHSKGLTKKEFISLKQKYGLSPHLATDTRRMTMDQLNAVLKAVERVRPKRIGYQKVITKKTEGKIQSLKDSLIEKYQLTEKAYQDTLKDLGIYKEPAYIDAKHFITEEKGKELIYRLIDESNILKITEPLRIALEKNPEIKKSADIIDRRVKSEGERTLKDPSDWNSARSYFQILETISGAPLYTLYQDLINCHLENRANLNHLIEGFDKYKDIIKDERELKKVEDYILAKSDLKDKPESPANITPKEIELAKKIEKILKDYQARARTEKFLDNIEHLEAMPQYLEYKKEMDKAKDIYESKGYDELVKYLETQKWGVIKSGYDPIQVVSARIRAYKAKALSLIFGKSHIEIRKDIEYKDQDTNIITRVIAYKRQMDNLSMMAPKVRALITLANKNLSKFKNPGRVKNNLQVFFNEIKGYSRATNWFERLINRLYSQAMITIIMGSPVLSFRNLGQNFALGHDKAMLVNPLNKKLTHDEIVYLDTYVQQALFMRTDWFLVGEKPLAFRIGRVQIGLERLTNLIKKINLYPRSDIANRLLSFWGKINQIRMAFDADVSLAKKMGKAKFSDFSLLEQKRALQILAKDGQKAMEKYVARVYTDDTHFLYERGQRSPTEMGPYGKVFGNLLLFHRAYFEKITKHGKKMTGKYVPVKERIRASKVLSSVLVGGALVSAVFLKCTGRRKPPYDPFMLLAYEPGGLMVSTVETVTDVYVDTIMAVRGDKRALADLTTAIPKLADMFVPFYNYTLRGYEAFLSDPLLNKNIDTYALRRLRMLIDEEYKVRGGAYSVERTAIEKFQYFLSGAGVDVTIRERKKREKEAEPIIIGKPKIPRLGIPKIGKPRIKKISPIKKF